MKPEAKEQKMSIYIKGERYICPECRKSYGWNWINRHLVNVHDYLYWDNERVCKRQKLENPTGAIYPTVLVVENMEQSNV